jgi:uncharacterized Fe-S cluster protein YjdI
MLTTIPFKEYNNEEIHVIWDKRKCIHAENCVRSLSGVFQDDEIDKVKLSGGNTSEIAKTIDACPSGALRYIKLASMELVEAEK